MGSYVGQLKVKAGTTLPTYGADDTGYTNVAVGDTISADSIIALTVGGKIIGASLIDIA